MLSGLDDLDGLSPRARALLTRHAWREFYDAAAFEAMIRRAAITP